MRSSSKLIAAAAGLALVSSGVALATVAPAQANIAGTSLVISEAYGGGGNGGSTYKNDFIEIYNPTGADISVAGWSVQYRSVASTGVGAVTNLSGSVPAGGYYLVQEAQGAGGTTDLPAPNATGTIAMAGTGFQVWLASTTTALTPPTGNVPAGTTNIVDFVGAAPTAASYETSRAPAPSNTTSVSRNGAGADTDVNSADFTAGAPGPQNSVTPPPPPPTTVDKTIAEIQGTGTSSPYAGDPSTYVRTQGVVTAVYGPSGYSSFVIQTQGSGTATDATPNASDGIAVQQESGAITVEKGDFVEITGPVIEDFGVTKLTFDPADPYSGITDISGQPHTAPIPFVTNYPTTSTTREQHESELLDVSGQHFTVSNNFPTNQYAEIGLATGDTPLVAPTETTDAQDTTAIAAATAANDARSVILDDGADVNFLSAANQDTPLPWLSPTNTVRVSSAAAIVSPVILDFQFGAWRFQPTERVTDEGTDVATFSDTRPENAAPQNVGGDLRLATANVLNYFNTTGVDYVAAGGGHTCTYFNDRDGNHVTDNTCNPNGPRGAAEDDDLVRQRDKIVSEINKLGADIVSLEEIENSVALGEPDRDDALASLVTALNTDAGSTRWAFAPSPDAADLPPTADQDVIRTGFIYNPATVDLVGPSKVLVGAAAFDNAREPLAQAFKPHGADAATTFGVIVNHFKSKGSGVDDHTGQGNANPDRVAQAEALNDFAEDFKTDRGITKLFLSGDFNAYSEEDPVQALEAHGYTNLVSDTPDEYSYNFGGMDGSLDHVFANAAALGDVTGVDIWNINADESVAFEYSRHNYNVTNFYQANQFRASDHDPEVIGIDVPGFPVPPPADEPVDTTLSATAGPMTYGTDGSVHVTVTSTKPTTGTVEVRDGSTTLGSAPVAGDGTATVAIPGTSLEPGSHTLTVSYSGDSSNKPSTGSVDVVVSKAAPTVDSSVSPSQVVVHKGTTTATATVDADGFQPGGTVTFEVDGVEAGEATLSIGSATLELGPFDSVGSHTVTATYEGDSHTTGGSSTSTVDVVKRDSTTTATATPKKVVVDRTRAEVTIRVDAPGDAAATGTVTVRIGGRAYDATLKNGNAVIRLRPFGSKGTKSGQVTYSGDEDTARSSTTLVIHVVKKGKHK
ncbi:MAG: Endonuclease/exonuclease/phosphatase [Nocardioides sp.]|nr:Endonuclease/exonuclease/phosphatase [Nocardioides sp.]